MEGIESLVGYSRGMELEQPDIIWTVIVKFLFCHGSQGGTVSFLFLGRGRKRVRKH